MPRPEQKKGELGTFVATLLIVGLIAAWALIPVQAMEAAWQSEQSQMSSLAGSSSDDWIKAQAAGTIASLAKDAKDAVDSLGESQIEHWLKGRIYVSLLWANLATYRASSLLMWFLLGFPLIIAASVDGFYVREIRKTSFVSQSPIRHKIGVHFFRLVSIAVVAWLLLPFPLPVISAPAVICFIAMSMWLWVGNLQKRL
jgi:hypothetical protein